jgi:hypothetical protein
MDQPRLQGDQARPTASSAPAALSQHGPQAMWQRNVIPWCDRYRQIGLPLGGMCGRCEPALRRRGQGVQLMLREHRANSESVRRERVHLGLRPVDCAHDGSDRCAQGAKRLGGVSECATGADDVLDEKDGAPARVPALCEATGAVRLGLLAHEQGG